MDTIAHNGWGHIEVENGMPGIKQVGKVANDRLKSHLTKYEYSTVPRTAVLWTHATKQGIVLNMRMKNLSVIKKRT